MENKTDVKIEIIDISGSCNNGTMIREVSSYPEWIAGFIKKCSKVNGTRCSEQLDELMEDFLVHIKKEVVLCASSPNRSALIANRMFKTMLFFYSCYMDIKEVYVMSLWIEHMSQLMPMYCQFEMKAALRLQRGKETDSMVCTRIMNGLWIFFGGNEEHIIHTILKVQNYSKKYKEMFDPIFKKMLVTSRTNKTYTDLEYVRNLLAFKIWKRLYFRHDKKIITDTALLELVAPPSFAVNSRKYKFLPCYADKPDVNNFLVTALFDLDVAVREYFAYIDNRKIRIFDTDFHHNEKKSFISDLYDSFSNHVNNMDDLASHVHENFAMDDVKFESDTIRIDEDDDLIIIDPDPEPGPSRSQSVAYVSSGTSDVIDLTADEPDIPYAKATETPTWCQHLIKLFEEQELLNALTKENTTRAAESAKPADEPAKAAEILRENVCTTPLDIMEDSNMSDTNSVGLTEITSTSHSVQDSALTSNEFPKPDGGGSFVEKIAISEVREVHQECDDFEHVDSTSNFNEDECETDDVEVPTVKTYVVESTVQQTQEGIVCSEVISEVLSGATSEVTNHNALVHAHETTAVICGGSKQAVAPVANSVFEQFMSERVVTESKNVDDVASVSASIQEAEANISDYTPSLRDSLDSDDILDEEEEFCQSNQLAMDEELDEELEPSVVPVVQDQVDGDEEYTNQADNDDDTSPVMEPISGNDFVNYLSSLTTKSYDDLQKEFVTSAGDLTVNRNRKNGERVVRTYNSVKSRAPKCDTPEQEPPRKSVISDKSAERRVPFNGEKVVRFADDLWEPVYTKSFKLSKREMACFTPEVRVRKRRYFDGSQEDAGRDDRGTATSTTTAAGTVAVDELQAYLQPQLAFAPQYAHLLPAYNTKTILERQDYLKDEKQQRAVVQKRPHFGNGNFVVDPSTSYDPKKLPDVVPQTKKRGAKQQVTPEVVTKKRKVGRRKSTRSLADSTPHPSTNSPVEQSPQITPWRFSIT